MLSLWTSGCSSHSTFEQVEQLAAKYDEAHPTITHIPVEDYLTQRDQWVLIDVRTPAEREVSWIPGSIPLSKVEQQPEHYVGQRLLLYCTLGWRSAEKAVALANEGYDAQNLHAGILAWVHAGQELQSVTGRTHRVHVFGSRWDLLPEGYRPVL